MANSGERLEELVRGIEPHLLGDSFRVAGRERILNDEGVQIAEFDIRITGALGSSSIAWLIECRYHPSGGAAPRSWIEQLYGRWALHHFDKVFAVSTTGFSVGARDAAERLGIILRTVDEALSTKVRSDEAMGVRGVVRPGGSPLRPAPGCR